VFSDRGVGADPVLVHESDKVGLREQLGLCGRALLQLAGVRDKLLPNLEVGELLARPLVVRVDFQVIASKDNEARRGEELLRNLDLH
jgi:hypothetical protein